MRASKLELADKLVEEGFLSYDDLSIIEPDELMAMGSLSEEEVTAIVEQAEALAETGGSGRRRSSPRRSANRNGTAEAAGETDGEAAEAGEVEEHAEAEVGGEESDEAEAAEEETVEAEVGEEESDDVSMLDASHAAPEGKD